LSAIAKTFTAMSPRRLFVFGGIALVALGMLFGDIFAVFVLHQNAGKQGAALVAATQAVAKQDAAAASAAFTSLGSLLEDRGTKVDTHVHMIGAGYLGLLLALAQPYVALGGTTKKFLAKLFVASGIALPIGIFTIHYIGLAYSPFPVIGWASVLADLSGFLLGAVVTVELWGVWCYVRTGSTVVEPELPQDRTWARRTLLSGGTFLVLLGFLSGAWYAAADLYRHEKMEGDILGAMLNDAVTNGAAQVAIHVGDFGNLAGEHAVKIAAHSHVIEFGVLAILLAFIQPFVLLSERWQRRWVFTLLAGSVILPVFVYRELQWGLVAGGIADIGGLMVIVALVGMLVGVVRYTGSLDGTGAAQ
jgi:hypothetical protein